MQHQKEQHIEYFEQLTDASLPAFFDSLDEQETEQVRQFIDGVLEKERTGLDSLFESMSQTLKYIPNFILHALTVRYISPPVAARITVKLVLKQALSVADGLPPEFIGETAVYMENDFAAIFLEGLPKKKAKGIVDYLMQAHPLKLLDIFAHTNQNMFKLIKPTKTFLAQDVTRMSELRLRVLKKIR